MITFDGDENCRNQIEFYELASKVMNLTIFDCYVVKVHKSTASHNFLIVTKLMKNVFKSEIWKSISIVSDGFQIWFSLL